ncbi:unnamed protein product, partial [Owenia fusiformis]
MSGRVHNSGNGYGPIPSGREVPDEAHDAAGYLKPEYLRYSTVNEVHTMNNTNEIANMNGDRESDANTENAITIKKKAKIVKYVSLKCAIGVVVLSVAVNIVFIVWITLLIKGSSTDNCTQC